MNEESEDNDLKTALALSIEENNNRTKYMKSACGENHLNHIMATSQPRFTAVQDIKDIKSSHRISDIAQDEAFAKKLQDLFDNETASDALPALKHEPEYTEFKRDTSTELDGVVLSDAEYARKLQSELNGEAEDSEVVSYVNDSICPDTSKDEEFAQRLQQELNKSSLAGDDHSWSPKKHENNEILPKSILTSTLSAVREQSRRKSLQEVQQQRDEFSSQVNIT